MVPRFLAEDRVAPGVLRVVVLLGAAACAALLGAGCVTRYQPMSRLHRPVAIDLQYANFPGLALTVHCLPGPVLMDWDAEEQCRKLSQLFENQGATVETSITLGRPAEPEPAAAEQPTGAAAGAAATPTPAPGPGPGQRLSMVLTNRLLHEEKSWWLPWVTTDYTFAEEIVVRDETGFLLVRDTVIGRLVKGFGFRSDTDEQLSRDYYGQLSQLLLDARMLRRVMGEAAQPAPVRGGPP